MTAEKMAREYADSKGNGIGDWFDRHEDFLNGYLAGQQSLWRKYPSEKPKHDTRCVVHYRTCPLKDGEPAYWRDHVELYDWYDDCATCKELWDHVERFIELPTKEGE